MDELGRLVDFKQGLLTNGTLDTGALTTQHQWRLDELGNWREHRGDPADSFLTANLDLVNAYTDWPVPFDDDGDGTPDVLARSYDAVRGVLYHRGEIGGGESTYVHDPFGRLSRVQWDTDGDGTLDVDLEYGYTAGSRLAWRTDHLTGRTVKYVHWSGQIILEI
ncbi:MAG: hypothetical protein Q9Q40_10065, partial [Acidobacteriota bacterium]|nr:hypothetical protein [Acidobacteriota bacterium]